MPLPRLQPEKPGDSARTDSVLFAVYAPFGSDETLSTFPEGSSRDLAQHPLYQGLLKVAASGVHVAALVDLAKDDTYLVEIEAGKPEGVSVTSRWKQDMASPNNLAGFLRHAHRSRPTGPGRTRRDSTRRSRASDPRSVVRQDRGGVRVALGAQSDPDGE